MEKDLNGIFLQLWTKFEKWLKNKYKDFDVFSSESIHKNEILKKDPNFWLSYKNLRNVIVHNDLNIPIANITKKGLEDFNNKIDQIMHPKKAKDICIKNVYDAKYDSKISDILSEMKKREYTNVPIVDKNKEVIGIFNYYTLFLYVNDNAEIVLEPEKMEISEFKKYYSLKNNELEFEFVGKEVNINDIMNIFDKNVETNKKIGALLVTENGKSNEKLLGIITIDDIYNNIKQ